MYYDSMYVCEHTHVYNLLSKDVYLSFPAATSQGGTGWAGRKDGEAPGQTDSGYGPKGRY